MNDDTQTRGDTQTQGETQAQGAVVEGGEETRHGPRTATPCPACGVFNPTVREVCRTCGADMETGGSLPWPEPDPDPEVRASQVIMAPDPRRWWLPVAAILAVAGLLLLGLVVAEVGPFAQPTSLPEARFDADHYDGEPQDLLLSDIATVTSQEPAEGRVFEAARMVDDDRGTAWHSDGLLAADEANGSLEIIDLFLDEPGWISALVLRNGDQIDLGAYEQTARIRRVRATVDGGAVYMLNLLDDGRGQQIVEFPEPVLSTILRMEVIEVFPGIGANGVAVSDLGLRGWTATAEDRTLAIERAEISPATAPPPPEARQSL